MKVTTNEDELTVTFSMIHDSWSSNLHSSTDWIEEVKKLMIENDQKYCLVDSKIGCKKETM